MLRALTLACALVAPAAHASFGWENGRVPEGGNAFTVPAGELRLSLFGRSAIGLSDSVELNSYLTVFVFPNAGLKWRIADAGFFAMAVDGNVGAGVLPVAFGVMIPIPGGLVGGGAVGALLGSAQSLQLHLSFVPDSHLALSLRGGPWIAEGAFFGIAGVAAVGDGVAGGVLPLVFHGAITGQTAGAEIDVPLGRHDAFTLSSDALITGAPPDALFYSTLSYTHGWKIVHLQVGGFLLNSTVQSSGKTRKPAIGPFVNLYFVFNEPRR